MEKPKAVDTIKTADEVYYEYNRKYLKEAEQ